MLSIALPKAPKYESIDKNSGRFIIEGCYPGYGTTIGNSLRRALLSSLPGSAITAIKIKGVTHEFTTIKGVKEDVVQIILNLKQVRFKLSGVDEATVFLKAKGEKEVTAKDIKSDSGVEVVNPDQIIANLTASSASLEMELTVKRGLGFLPVEQQQREEKEIGTIAVDAIYNPVRRVNFKVDNMRVGKRTDYDKITMEIVTDGSVTPQDAYKQATKVLIRQFEAVAELYREGQDDELNEMPAEFDEEKSDVAQSESIVDEDAKVLEEEFGGVDATMGSLGLSTRTLNILAANNINKVSEIAIMTEEEILKLEGMGEKGIKEIKKAIGSLGITLKSAE